MEYDLKSHIEYDLAVDDISAMIGAYTNKIAEEESKEFPNSDVITHFMNEQRKLLQTLNTLDITDCEKIKNIRIEAELEKHKSETINTL